MCPGKQVNFCERYSYLSPRSLWAISANFQIAVFAVSAAILPVKPSFDRGHLAERVEHLFSSGAWRIQSPLRSQGKCVFRALYFHEAGQEERRLVRKALDRLIDLVVITAARSYGVLRFLGRGLGIDPQSHPRIASLIEAIQDTGERAEVFDREFADHIDPWNYAGNPTSASVISSPRSFSIPCGEKNSLGAPSRSHAQKESLPNCSRPVPNRCWRLTFRRLRWGVRAHGASGQPTSSLASGTLDAVLFPGISI